MKIPALVRRGLAAVGMFWKRHGATVVMISGTASVVAGEIFAVKAGTKVEEVLEPREIEKAKLEAKHDNGEIDEKEYRKELRAVKVGTVKDFTKLFWPSVALTGGGIGMIFASHGMMKHSIAVTAAGAAALKQSFDDYRERVKSKIGDEAEEDLFNGIETTEKLEEITDAAGKKKTVKRVHKTYTGSASPYAVIFDETNPNWKGVESADFAFIKLVQSELCDKLFIEKYVFWNDMLVALGFEKKVTGQKAGCRLSMDGETDNYIDFGIFDKNGRVKDWALKMYRDQHKVLIDFNLDGDIIDKIGLTDIQT